MRKSLTLFMVLMFSVLLSFSQNRMVTGKVTDENGNPVPFATIKIKGAKTGVAADVNGNYQIDVRNGTTLVISAQSMETAEIDVAGKSTADVNLKTSGQLAEVTVSTGVGVATSKKRIAFAVETVQIDKTAPTASVDQFLVGKVAGAQISSTNGSPGQPVNILLRGINTLNRGTSPMILLDGIEVGATEIGSLDLSNIERVEVVQGAASASIYGAQGANGVIQLFSKKGKQGKINIDIFSAVSTTEMLNVGDQHMARFHSLQTNSSNQVVGAGNVPLAFDPDYSHFDKNVIWNSLDPTNNNNKLYNANLQYYDLYKMFFQKAHIYNNSFAISGGRERMDFVISGSDSRQNTNFKGNGDYSRSNINTNVGIELFKNFRVRSITQLAYTKNTQVDPTGRTIMYALNNSRPFANYDYKSPDGNYGAYFGDAVGVNGYNPNYVNQYFSVNDNKHDLIENLNANYKFKRFVELDVKYGLNYQTQERVHNIADQSNNLNADYWQYWVEYYAPSTSYGSPSTKEETGEIGHFRWNTTFQNLLTTATIRTDFQNDFHLKIPIRTTTQVAYDYRKRKFNQYITYGLDAPNYTPYTASQMGTYKIESDYTEPFLTYGFLVNQRIEWGNLAGISGGLRQDYSSAFGRGQTPKTFPRGDAYLNIDGFNFWNNSGVAKIIPTIKLRAAYGEAGIQPHAFDRYVTLNTRNIGTNVAFLFPTSNPNANLDVEVSKELEIGTDIGLSILKGNWLKNGNLSFTYWDRKTENAIWDVDAAPSTGTGTVKDNAFGLASHGIQASLNLNVLTGRNFTWNFTTLFSKQTSEISSVVGQPVVVTSAAGSTGYQLVAGKKIGQLYGYLMLHSVNELDPSGNPYIPKADQGNFIVASNGWVVYKDGTANAKQPYVTPGLYSFGDPNPKFNMSFINDLSYKGVRLSMQWDWVNGSHLYNQTKEWMYRDGIHGDYDKPITVDGQSGAWTAFYRGVYAQVSRNGTKNYFYEDASFWRLRNLAVQIDVAKFVHLPYFQRLELVLSGRNIVTFTDYTGMDPEVSSGTHNSAFDRGVDHNTVPNLKTYQIGLNIGF
ncbi:MAG TPA: SusC/RagA family TonB-linked outer membrane protein [Chitinophagaceae bacterium]|nr:SusC/RagA family TonB-linked outer membrane protein [Chitinophagaceae bacterium]